MTATQLSMLSVEQHETTSDDYYTPRWVFERMGIEFDLDVCSPPGGIPWIPAKRYFTKADDGLAQEWEGRVWMNPPYSNPTPWVERLIHHGDGVGFVQVSKGRFSGWLWERADAMTLMPHNFKFLSGEDGRERGIYMPVWMAAFGEECVDAIARLGPVRVLR